MKKVFIALFLMLMVVGIYAQERKKTFENSYLSMSIPDGWEVVNMPMQGVNMELVVFLNGDDMRNVGMVIGLEQLVSPRAALETQMSSQSNALFAKATFGNAYSTTFMGRKAEAVDFSTTFNGVSLKGAAYAFNVGDCSLIAIGCYRPGMKSDLPQIWRSIRWKQHSRKTYASFEDEIKDFIPSFNELVKKKPVIVNDCQIASLDYDITSKCIIYRLRLVNASRFDLSEADIETMKQTMKQMLPSILKEDAANTEIVRHAIKNGYSFKYICSDRGDNHLYDVMVTPDEYNK